MPLPNVALIIAMMRYGKTFPGFSSSFTHPQLVNVYLGAKYFVQQLQANGGNILRTLGGYNGWTVGMTKVRFSPRPNNL
jgi:soluble lytic murein transglycosylase-like protein